MSDIKTKETTSNLESLDLIFGLNLGRCVMISNVMFMRSNDIHNILYVGSFHGKEIITLPPEGILELIDKVGITQCKFI